MFEPIKELIVKAKRLNPNRALKDALDNTSIQQDIIAMNQEQMYEQGEDSKGKELGAYSNFTIQKKIEKGQRWDHITLRDTGAFYASMKFRNRAKAFIISADMVKEDTNLETIYPDALGLNEKNMSILREWVLPSFRENLRKQLLG